MPHDKHHSYTARFVFPGDAEPIVDGTVEIVGRRISAVHDRRDPQAEDCGNAAIIPGLINAHTHLEFSDLPAPIAPARPFADWIRGLVAHRRARTTDVTAIVRRGIRESVQSGTTALGEIATDDDVNSRATFGGPHVTAFREILGFAPEQIESQSEIASAFLQNDDASPQHTQRAQRALSPHAPYSVHPELLHRCVDLAREYSAPVAMHVAETQDELQLLESGTGSVRDMLESFGVWRDNVLPRGMKPMDCLIALAEAPRGLVIHGNFLDDAECGFIAEKKNLALVYCPRTHHYFGLEDHPWRKVLNAGGVVAVGTDSRASNPDLSLWGELQFLRAECDDLSDAELLRLGTINGAIALGIDDASGTLAAGRSADLCVVPFSAENSNGGLFGERASVARTMIAGEWVAG